jgi:hypothetical protein
MNVKLLSAVAVATAAMAATPANAAITLDTCTMSCTGPTTSSNVTTIGYSDTGLESSFTESLSFTNDAAALYSITLTTSTSAVDFTSAILSDGVTDYNLHKIVDDGTNEFWSFVNPPSNQYNIGAGTYTLTLMGDNHDSSGSLGGTVTITAAVPEPATWGMMLLGFAGMGLALRRRRQPVLAQIA